MAVVVDQIVRPALVTSFMTFRVKDDTDESNDITVTVDGVTVYALGAFTATWNNSSTVSGLGTVASPWLFSIRPDANWDPGQLLEAQLDVSLFDLAMPASNKWDFRLHTTEAVTFVDKLIAQPGSLAAYFGDCRLMLVVTYPQTQGAMMIDVGTKCATLGLPVFAGVQVMVTPETFATGWGSAAHWLSMTDDLETVRDTFEPYWTDDHLMIDWESYKPSMGGQPTAALLAGAGFTVGQCQTAMQPFLEVVQGMRKIPYMYPIVPGDVLCPLVTQIFGKSVVSDENVFQWERRQRRDPIDYQLFLGSQAVRDHQILVENPGAEISPSSFDDILRAYGRLARNDDGWLGISKRRGWVFKLNGSDFVAHVGSEGWYQGTVLSTLNDVKWSWKITSQTIRVPTDLCWGSTYDTVDATQLNSWRLPANAVDNTKTPRLDGWLVSGVTDCKYFQLDSQAVIPVSADFSIKLPTFVLPAATGDATLGNISTIAGIGRVWQFVYDKTADQIQLLTRLSGVQTDLVVATAPTRGTDQNYVISYQHGTKTWRVNGATMVTTNAFTSTSVLRLGACFDIPTGDVVQGFDGLLWKVNTSLEVWNRYLSTSEEVTARTGTYPRGII